MSSDASAIVPVPVPVPRTAVPLGIADPVEKARAELKAALAAIEVKANVPRRVSRADRRHGREGARVLQARARARDRRRGRRSRRRGRDRLGAGARSTRADRRPRTARPLLASRAWTGHARRRAYARREAVQWCGCCRRREPDSNARRLLERHGRPTQSHESRPHEHSPPAPERQAPRGLARLGAPRRAVGRLASRRRCAPRALSPSSRRSSTSPRRTTRRRSSRRSPISPPALSTGSP